MKSVKKIIAALSAATMVSACAGVVASAAEAVNAVNVSYSTVAETFTAADGTVVAAAKAAIIFFVCFMIKNSFFRLQQHTYVCRCVWISL